MQSEHTAKGSREAATLREDSLVGRRERPFPTYSE